MRVLLVLSWFPPTNVIGSVRGYQIARFLADAGHSVHVIHIERSGFREDYAADVTGISRHPVDAGRFVRWLAPTASNNRFSLVRSLARQLFYPDPYITVRKRYRSVLENLVSAGFVPDIILSSALPFSLHSIADTLAARVGAKWVADNRDLWATSAYRRRAGILRRLDVAYERRLLRRSDLVVAVGRNMARDLSQLLGPETKVREIRNGADVRTLELKPRDLPGSNAVRFVYTGTLYGGFRDIHPLLDSIRVAESRAQVDFYGSEPAVVRRFQEEYPEIEIRLHEAVSKSTIKEIQRDADFLVVALGASEFEKGVLTGKFFEYVEARRPIVAICDEDSELAHLVSTHNLGVASRSVTELSRFLSAQIARGVPDLPRPDEELSRDYQLARLEGHMMELLSEE